MEPVPLSAVINRSKKRQPISQATLIQAVMEKVNQVKVHGHKEAKGQMEADKGQENVKEKLDFSTAARDEEM